MTALGGGWKWWRATPGRLSRRYWRKRAANLLLWCVSVGLETVSGGFVRRGFKSLPLRLTQLDLARSPLLKPNLAPRGGIAAALDLLRRRVENGAHASRFEPGRRHLLSPAEEGHCGQSPGKFQPLCPGSLLIIRNRSTTNDPRKSGVARPFRGTKARTRPLQRGRCGLRPLLAAIHA